MSRERFAAALQRAARDPLVIEKAFAQYLAFVSDGSGDSEAAANAGEEQADAVEMSRGDSEGDSGGALLPDPHVASRSSGQSAGPLDALEQLRAFQGQQNAAPPSPAPAPAPIMPLNTPPKMDALEQLRAFQQGPPPSLAGGADRRRGVAAGGLAALGHGALAFPPPPQQQQQSGQNLVDKLAAMMQQQQQQQQQQQH